jgi:hypothetical protein
MPSLARLTFVTLASPDSRVSLSSGTIVRNRLTIAACVLLGLALGYGAGFATCVVGVFSEMSFLTNPYAGRDSFTKVFRGFGRLGAAETVAGVCGSPKKDPLAAEDLAIHAIQDAASAVSLNPPLDVARARLALRRANLAEKNNDPQRKAQYEDAASQLLQKSGWKDPSPAHMRQIVTQIDTDGNTCSPSQAKAGQQK